MRGGFVVVVSSQFRFWVEGRSSSDNPMLENSRGFGKTPKVPKRFPQKAPKCFLFVFKDSESLNLLRHDDGVVLADRFALHRLVVERAVVLPVMRMRSAVSSTAAALEALDEFELLVADGASDGLLRAGDISRRSGVRTLGNFIPRNR